MKERNLQHVFKELKNMSHSKVKNISCRLQFTNSTFTFQGYMVCSGDTIHQI